MKKTGVGVIGCGAISGNHFHALGKLDGVEVRCVCDIDQAKRKAAMAAEKCGGCADWRDLISRKDIDAVHVCVPHCLHAEISIAAMENGKHVLCEKPLGMSAAEARAMAETAERTGRTLTCCFQNRYNGASVRMKALADSGVLGAPRGGTAMVAWNRAEPYYRDSPWRGRWATEGGSVLINQAVHTLDLLRWLTGEMKVRSATLSAKRLAETIETEDTCDLLLEGAYGARFLFFASNCAPANMPVEMHLLYDKGEMHLRGTRLTVKTEEGETTEDYAAALSVGKEYWGSGHGPLIEDFYRRLWNGEPSAIPPEDAMKTTLLLEESYTCAAAVRRRPE